MSHINHQAIQALETFAQKHQGQYAAAKATLVIHMGHDGQDEVMAGSRFEDVPEAIVAARAFAEKGIVIGSVEATILSADKAQTFELYPPSDDGDHGATCCGGCGG